MGEFFGLFNICFYLSRNIVCSKGVVCIGYIRELGVAKGVLGLLASTQSSFWMIFSPFLEAENLSELVIGLTCMTSPLRLKTKSKLM